MSFPLMPGYDHINLVAELEPGAALRDREIGERIRDYRRILPAGSPDFGHAVQTGSRWRIGCLGATDPSAARYGLAMDLRQAAAEDGTDAATARAMRAAADRLDPEEGEQLPKDEWELGDRRYRVIRIEKYTLIGDRVMEPPRPSDGALTGIDSMLRGHPIDPRAPAGQWEAQLRLNLVGYMPMPGTVPEIVRTEARHAIRTHPGVVLLPPTFTVVEVTEDAWEPLTGGSDPDDARDHLAGYFSRLLPRLREFQGDPATPAEMEAWAGAAARITAATGHEFTALGRRFRTVRVSRMLRLGRDGPEAPRPSDQERYGVPEVVQDES
ncbi:DUF5954 family protein [Actinomadura rugatobispora]|uniref:DUF5954 family protein n=1 Tax=Actinomadura rugatobispora TaxID=1994 RepID=A0ABW1AH48_9ACTN|nr:hypothetical protein GCM10010200_014870 [Actinomadura rugatobispora]